MAAAAAAAAPAGAASAGGAPAKLVSLDSFDENDQQLRITSPRSLAALKRAGLVETDLVKR
jgi:hypothetical protein